MSNTKPRIMVVDDSQSMHAAAKSALGEEYELMCCEDGLDAVASIAAFKPHLVFVDITMPKMDGYETVSLIRINRAFKDVPVLMMSSRGGFFDVAHGRLLGFNGNIQKPFKPADLRAAVAEHLNLNAYAAVAA